MTEHIFLDEDSNYEEIIISGAKGPSEPDPPDPPVEEPNTLHSKSVLRFIDMLGEGEIEGLVDGAKSIYVNNVPLQNDSGEWNFNGIEYEFRRGTEDQEPAKIFPDVESSYG